MTDSNNFRSYLTSQGGLDYLYKIASLELAAPEIRAIKKFGKSKALTADVEVDIWDYTSGNLVPLTSASTLSCVSSSANDVLAGTGGGVLLLDGLDADYNDIQEVVYLNGTTPVVTTNSFIFLNQSRIVSAGSTKSNVGNITITASSNASVQGYIVAERSLARSTYYMVPAGYSAFIVSFSLSVLRTSGANAARAVEFDLHITSGNVNYKTQQYTVGNAVGLVQIKPNMLSYIPPKALINYSAIADTNNTNAVASYELLLIKGDYNLYTGL